TTKVGHMNAFPLEEGGPKPDSTLMDWVQLVQGIREKGAKVVILNHPRWPQIPTGPFGEFGLSRLTGELPGQTAVPFDAMELVNSTTVERDPMFLFVDWFALLNHGQTMTAAGTSDSHTVGDPVGQGRTYVPSRTDDPARIDVDASCEAFQQGRTTISMGIFVEVNVGDAKGPGDVCHVNGRRVGAELRVAAPSWVRPRTAIAFVNGIELARQEVPVEDGAPTDANLVFDLALPPHDGHLVFVVLGDPVTSPHWRTMNRYTLAATNPVWLDVDSRNGYQSPRSIGESLAQRAGDDPEALAALVADADDAVAVQALHAARLGWQKGSDLPVMVAKARAKVAEVVAARPDRAVLREYLDSLGP
ncbi:MAG: CehA/McbA family metallohydrolase, partial [Planctomycetota bacterium]